MAKEDFCFTYYDGDAARDMAHMNRLERGGYGDLIVSQRKFGHLSLDLIKKTLGSDFETIWDAIRIVLRVDEEGRFFIDWLENSIEKMRRQSVKQSQNGKQGGRPKANENPNHNPNETQTITQEKPLEDGDGYGNTGLKEGGMGETNQGLIIPEMVQQFVAINPSYPVDSFQDYSAVRLLAEKIHSWLKLPGLITDSENQDPIKRRWGEMVAHVKADAHLSTYSLSQINKYFQTIAQGLTGKSEPNQQRNNKTGKSAGAEQLLAKTVSLINAGGKPDSGG